MKPPWTTIEPNRWVGGKTNLIQNEHFHSKIDILAIRNFLLGNSFHLCLWHMRLVLFGLPWQTALGGACPSSFPTWPYQRNLWHLLTVSRGQNQAWLWRCVWESAVELSDIRLIPPPKCSFPRLREWFSLLWSVFSWDGLTITLIQEWPTVVCRSLTKFN